MEEGKQKHEKMKEEEKLAGQLKQKTNCIDKQCPFHGNLKSRGRNFKGFVVRKFPRRLCIEFERVIYVKKYERYMKKKTRIHARLPDCLKDEINAGDYIEVRECRPLSKIIHFVVIKKVRSKEEEK